jgi:hypothetical protein
MATLVRQQTAFLSLINRATLKTQEKLNNYRQLFFVFVIFFQDKNGNYGNYVEPSAPKMTPILDLPSCK